MRTGRLLPIVLILCFPMTVTLPHGLGTVVADMAYPRQEHASVMLGNGKVLIVGWNANTAELYDPTSGTFGLTGSTNANHRQGFTATLLNNGKVLIVGGVNALKVAELYDPGTGLFSLTDSLDHVHSYHTATLLPDGKVLIAGGQDHVGPQTHAVSEIYDPQSGKFTLTDTLNEHRSGHTATLLPDGKVLIAGGLQTTTPGSGKYLGACEVYDPGTRTFALIQSLSHPRISHTATLLNNQKVLVAGGAWNVSVCELYDPLAKTWTATGPLTVIRRANHTATLLPDGKALLAGGYVESTTSRVEIYDPVTNTFSADDSMTTARMQHCASLLANGDVLVTGGYDGSAAVRSAELLVPSSVTAVDRKTLPESFSLDQNYPNPFNPSTTIKFELPKSSAVRLSVFDMLGREVSVLVNERREAGVHEVKLDASGLSSGVCFYRLQAGDFVRTRKLLLVR